jgi:hypothetical protein
MLVPPASLIVRPQSMVAPIPDDRRTLMAMLLPPVPTFEAPMAIVILRR